MDRDGLRLAVRRAPLPYFRPFVIVNLHTNEVVGHYQTEGDAQVALNRMMEGAIRVKASQIQPNGDVFKAQEARMKHPFGEKQEALPDTPTGLGRRRVQL